ncbi:hypothetical protein [Eisenbergiella tayi]|uniref:hypothetical protein n=1 Tax=Eisenbergiella tayi TaxID=1432052 RepID=UPI0008490B90|nr:hypothetical protein [Eisenbergiella tayi]ODR33607.1 hypothetical protein BEI60_23835 [Eisenbergiella tayi]
MIQESMDKYMLQRSYNYALIMKMWKKLYSSMGENRIKGKENDFSSLYAVLEYSRDTLRGIVEENYTYDNEKVEKKAASIEKKTGIAKEYLTGRNLIILHDITEEEVYQYMENKYLIKESSDNILNILDHKVKKKEMESILNGNIPSNLKNKLLPYINEIKKLDGGIAEFENRLDTAIQQFLATESTVLARDEKLYNLRYFILNKKRFDTITVDNIYDVMNIMKRSRARQLMGVKSVLKDYIQVLEEQLDLAKSVYKVAVDLGDITENNK